MQWSTVLYGYYRRDGNLTISNETSITLNYSADFFTESSTFIRAIHNSFLMGLMQNYKDFKLIIDSYLWKLFEIFHIIVFFSGLDMKGMRKDMIQELWTYFGKTIKGMHHNVSLVKKNFISNFNLIAWPYSLKYTFAVKWNKETT